MLSACTEIYMQVLLMYTEKIRLTSDNILPLTQLYSIFKLIEGDVARVHLTHVKTAHYV